MVQQSHRRNLREKDFRSKNLEEKDFSHADIRGTDFSNANLAGAKFRHVEAGLSTSWAFGLAALSLSLAFLAGLIAAYAGALIGYLVTGNADELSLFGFIAAIALATFLIVTVSQGFGVILVTLAEIAAACLIAAIAFFPENEAGWNLALGAEFTALGLVGTMAGFCNMAVAVAIARAIALPKVRVLTGLIAFIGILLGALLGVRQEGAYFISGLVALAAIILGTHVGWQAISGEKKNTGTCDLWLQPSLSEEELNLAAQT